MIFVGLDRAPVASVLRSDTRVTVAMALILLLLGFTGFISLLIAQGYRQARTSLSQVRAFSDNLLEHVPIGIIAMDASGFITSCNREAESILQVDASVILGKRGRSALPSALAGFLERLTERNSVLDEEFEYPLPDNRQVSLGAIATLLVEDDHGMGSILIIRDLTEVKRLQNEIDRSRRLASLGRLAAGVAHEIRNPLSSIKGFATYFKERYHDVPEDRKTAAIMIDEVDRLNRVVGQLLDFSRPVKVRSTNVPIVSLVKQSLEKVESRLRERNITIETDVPSEDREISVDADGLSQSLLNLYINAMEAMPSEGRLTVRVRYSDENDVVISVADTGTGIERSDQAKIFDPYFTTKPSGTGLGLAIVHKIVEAHEGTVNVVSEPDQGTEVTVTIPSRKIDGKEESWSQ